MNGPLYVTPAAPVRLPDVAAGTEVADLLRQLLDVQREQVALLKAQQAAQDNLSRWKAFLNRWAGEFPGVGGACRQALPALERAYLELINDLTNRLKDVGPEVPSTSGPIAVRPLVRTTTTRTFTSRSKGSWATSGPWA